MKQFIFSTLVLFAFTSLIPAADPAIWSVNNRTEVIKGDARGVSIDENGSITVAPKLNELFNSQQSFIWSTANDSAGNVFLGTGNDGKIFKVDAAGKGQIFSDLAELDVTALAVAKDGSLYAGTSPDGKVYRIDAAGKAEVYFQPKDKYIWSLYVLLDGSLAVGTGENGKIYIVKTANTAPESALLFDSSETHIISMTGDRAGNLYAGTDSNGIVLRITPDGKAFAVLDAALREIHELSTSPDGTVYALALSEAASVARPNPATVTGQASDGSTVVMAITSVEGAEQTPAKSRYDLSTAKSAVYRIATDGSSEIIWSSATVTGFSLLAHSNGSGALLGTSDKGRIYDVSNNGRETLLAQTNESQVSKLFQAGTRTFAATSNSGKLFAFGSETLSEGTYDSVVRDAKNTALWGRIWWNSTGSVQLQTRTGNTAKPDETWSEWSPAMTDSKGGRISSPKARFMQWRATLRTGGKLNEVSVSYVSNNIAPEVLSIQLFPTSVGLFANPPMQIDPNIETLGLDPVAFGLPPAAAVPPRRAFQRGARALQWVAEDRNGDKLEYALYYRAATEENFKLLRDGLTDNFFTLDGLALADGRYIFKVVAKDMPSNPSPLALTGERISEPIDVDNTAPQVSSVGAPQLNGDRVRVVFDATDASSFVRRAEYSIDGGEWKTVFPDDGIADSKSERFTFEVMLKTPGEYSVTLRVFDASGNAANARVLVKR